MRVGLLKTSLAVALVCLVTGRSLWAQEHSRFVLSGTVRGIQTGELLSGATIRLIGTTLGTATNSDGRYRLLLARGKYQVIVSYIGYTSDTVRADIQGHDVSLDVALSQSQVSLPEVMVYPKSGNPANEIIRRAIAAKEKWLEKLHSYEFNAYTKTVLKVVKQSELPDTTIAGILETQTKGYWKSPDSYFEIVSARRQTANFTSAQNIFTAGRLLDFNNDVIKIDRYSIPGPISSSAFDYYRYAIVDTSYQGKTMILGIEVEPRKNPSPMFKGLIEISQGSWALVRARLSLSDPGAIAPPMDSPVYDEQFAEYEDAYRLPIELKTSFVVRLRLPGVPPVILDNVSVLYDYKFNPAFPKSFFDRDVVSATAESADKDTTAWRRGQGLPLTRSEALAYARIDSIIKNVSFPMKAVISLTRLISDPDLGPFTSVSDFFHFNRVEGAYVGVGVTNSTLIDGVELTTIGGYGFSDKMWKYDLTAAYKLPGFERLTFGGRIFRRIANRKEEDMYSRFDVSLGSLLYRDDYRDYYLSGGWQGFLDWRVGSTLAARVTYSDERQSSVSRNTNYSIFPQSYNYRSNPPIDDGYLRSVDLEIKLDTRKFYDTGISMQSDEGSSYWTCSGSLEISSPEILNSSFPFDRFRVSFMRHQMTFASGYLNLWVIGGSAVGELPVQRMFEIQSAYGGYTENEAMATLVFQRLLSNKTIMVGAEHDFANSLFKWSNIPLVKQIWFDVSIYVHGAVAEGCHPMAESGFGLVNVLPFIRTDFTWGVEGACRGFAWTIGTTLEI